MNDAARTLPMVDALHAINGRSDLFARPHSWRSRRIAVAVRDLALRLCRASPGPPAAMTEVQLMPSLRLDEMDEPWEIVTLDELLRG